MVVRMRIAVTGSSGLIGTTLVAALRAEGHQVIRLVRAAPAGDDMIAWDPRADRGGLDPRSLQGVAAVVHLAGAGVAGRRWTDSYKAEIKDSRVQGTKALVSALTAMATPPAVLLSGSAIGWYGDVGGREVDESSPAGTGFLADVVRDWEGATEPAGQAGIRVITMRTGLVLSPDGGVLARLLPLFRLGLGARLGPGTQAISWIALSEMVAIVRFLLTHDDVSGPVNVTTPNPVTNREFTSALAAAVHRPAVLAVPVPLLQAAIGGASSELLSSARVLPRRLLAAGYQYRHPGLAGALATELAPHPSVAASGRELPGPFDLFGVADVRVGKLRRLAEQAAVGARVLTEQGHPPERRHRAPGAAQQLQPADRHPDQPPGADQRHQSQRQLHQERREQAEREALGAPVQRGVEPRVAAEQRRQDHEAHDQDLPPPPGSPCGRREDKQQPDVEPDPGRPPAASPIVSRQLDLEHADPDSEHHHPHEAGRDEEPAPALAEGGRVDALHIEADQGPGKAGPFLGGHLPQVVLVKHSAASSRHVKTHTPQTIPAPRRNLALVRAPGASRGGPGWRIGWRSER
jgi:uncharacterized protein